MPNLETSCWIAEHDITLQTNAFIGSDKIVSAIRLQILYHTADEHVYRYSDKRVLYWRRTLLVLETNAFGAGDEHISARDKCVENAHLKFSYTHS